MRAVLLALLWLFGLATVARADTPVTVAMVCARIPEFTAALDHTQRTWPISAAGRVDTGTLVNLAYFSAAVASDRQWCDGGAQAGSTELVAQTMSWNFGQASMWLVRYQEAMAGGGLPASVGTAVPEPTATATATATSTSTPVPTATRQAQPTATATAIPTMTATATPVAPQFPTAQLAFEVASVKRGDPIILNFRWSGGTGTGRVEFRWWGNDPLLDGVIMPQSETITEVSGAKRYSVYRAIDNPFLRPLSPGVYNVDARMGGSILATASIRVTQ